MQVTQPPHMARVSATGRPAGCFGVLRGASAFVVGHETSEKGRVKSNSCTWTFKGVSWLEIPDGSVRGLKTR